MSSPPHPLQGNEFPSLTQVKNTVSNLVLNAYTNITSSSPLPSFKHQTILVLIHGYPQSPYEWRHLAPILVNLGYPIFVPDLPGYANSPDRTHSLPQDKLSVGTAILESISIYLSSLNTVATAAPQGLILLTHDRGSRIGHRVSVSKPLSDKFTIKALAVIDIVPTLVQVRDLGRPEVAKGYFHWSLLANVDLAVKIITSFGGANWVTLLAGSMGDQRLPPQAERMEAVQVYRGQWDDEDVIRASCRDYEAGLGKDIQLQREDQEAGKKVDIPMMVVWAEEGVGRWFDVPKVWSEWVVEGLDVEFVPVAGGASHYIPEDAPEFLERKIVEWLVRIDL